MRTDLNLTGWNGASERRRLEVLVSWVVARVRQMKNTHMGRQEAIIPKGPDIRVVLWICEKGGSVHALIRYLGCAHS